MIWTELCVLSRKSGQSYADAVPIQPMIDQLNAFYDDGHTIIINTARHMVTCNNDVDLVVKRIGDITLDWLKRHNVKFTALQFGKPYGDLYIDDKACSNDPAEIARRVDAIERGVYEDYIESFNILVNDLFNENTQ
jgi:capsule biosynthesis phosphatase